MDESYTYVDSQIEASVLVVDDKPYIAKAAARLLRTMGSKVLVATAGQEAVDICRTSDEKIDVILLDAVLPVMTSVEVLRQIRSVRPEIKVILMSGYSLQESTESFAGIKLDGILSKPFGYSELEDAMRAALNPRSA